MKNPIKAVYVLVLPQISCEGQGSLSQKTYYDTAFIIGTPKLFKKIKVKTLSQVIHRKNTENIAYVKRLFSSFSEINYYSFLFL